MTDGQTDNNTLQSYEAGTGRHSTLNAYNRSFSVEDYNTDNLKYSKMAECLALADVAKPYFSRSFMSSQCLIA